MDFITGGQLTVRITATDVGKRVSVRRLVDAGGPVEKFTDVVGVLTSWDAGVLRVTRRTGEIVRIPESALVAGKVVPAAPARRRGPAASARELDRVAARAWPPVESESLGDWTLRAAGGFTRRANSVLPLGEGPGLPLDEALGRITDWYGHRGLPAYIQVSTGAEGTQELLAAELAERGWVREVPVEVRIAALAPLADAEGGPGRVRLTRTVGDGWLARYQRSAGSAGSAGSASSASSAGSPGPGSSGPGPEVLQVLGSGPSVWFATVPAEAVQPEAAAGPGETAG
ncbi:MAG TPA: GNAT family N-acetyltransferase, partial [Streptomyces sp.]|nr:GNAT family N-acetyltransferase [Streptomyces sp.]